MKNMVFTSKILLLMLLLAASVRPLSADVPENSRGHLYKGQQTSDPNPVKGFPLPIRDALKTATEVKFYERDKDYQWKALPLAVLSEQSHPHMFHLMKAALYRRGPGFSRIAMCKVAFINQGKVILEVGYYANIGWLTEPQHQNGQIPSELQKWLYSLTSIPESMGQA